MNYGRKEVNPTSAFRPRANVLKDDFFCPGVILDDDEPRDGATTDRNVSARAAQG